VASALGQAALPFAGEVAPHTAAGSSAAPLADQVALPCLDPGDPDSDLEGLSNADLLRHLGELKESPDRRPAAILRRLKTVVLLQRRGVLAEPRWARLAAAGPAPAKSRDAEWPRKVLFRTALDRVTKADGVLGAERFAEWLAEDLWDARSIADFRRIANGLRSGVLTRELVLEAYRRAKGPGIRNQSAFFRRYVWDRSPWAATQARPGQRRREQLGADWFQ
jgi:hypothetical protein